MTCIYSFHLNNPGDRGVQFYFAVENPCITLQSAVCNHGSAFMNSATLISGSTTVLIYWIFFFCFKTLFWPRAFSLPCISEEPECPTYFIHENWTKSTGFHFFMSGITIPTVSLRDNPTLYSFYYFGLNCARRNSCIEPLKPKWDCFWRQNSQGVNYG